jgi:hypothetical protein
MSNVHVSRSFAPGLTDPATIVPTMPVRARPIALKILSGAGLIALSFWLTLHAMEYFQSQWEQVRSNAILTFGDASASAISFNEYTKFQFSGNGYAQIQDTKSLQCLKFKCSFSLMATFAPSQSSPQLIIGQSFNGEPGWHLLVGGGRMVLLPDGGNMEVAASFTPELGQRYKIDITRDEQEVRLSVNDIVVAKSRSMPFTELARDLTIGGRPGPSMFAFAGTISDVQIAQEKSHQK